MLQEIVARAVKPGMTDREKATALWWQEVQYRFHFQGDNKELLDPVKVFNIYGHNTCGNDSIALAGEWKKAGLRVAPARLVGHCVSQVFDDGRLALDGRRYGFDLSPPRQRDGRRRAGPGARPRPDPPHSYPGHSPPGSPLGDEWESSIYVFEGR